jgi:vacuolar protein sorting-associated protein 13D
VEILQFLQIIVPSGSGPASSLPDSVQPKNSDSSIIGSSSVGRKIQANFEFHRLNVLLLRGVVGKDGTQVARKIATATASNARVNCNLRKKTKLQNFKFL